LARYLAHIGVVLKTTEYTTGRAVLEREMLWQTGPIGRGAAQLSAPRPSNMMRSLYLAFGFLALRWMLRRESGADLLLRLRKAGF